MTQAPMAPAIEERLRAHVAATVASAGVAAYLRNELEEELLGHLIERWNAHVTDGMDATTAADQAIADFGRAADIGRELGSTYHSRLWASTIGVLLPAVAAPAGRPSAIGWLRFVLGLMAVLNAVAVLALAALTPVYLVVTTAGLVMSTVGLVLAFIALGRAQRWALTYAMWAAALLLALGLLDLLPNGQASEVTIPLGTILGAIALLVAYRQRKALDRFVAGSSAPRGVLAVALAASLLATLAPRAIAVMPDPTQATADDLVLRMEMACGHRDLAPQLGRVIADAQVATIVVDATWAQTDLLPLGLARFFSGADDADTSAIRVNGVPKSWLWDWGEGPTVIDLASGEQIGTWGSTAQSNNLLPDDILGILTIALERHELHPDQTVRMTWNLYWAGKGLGEWPVIDVYYAHLDRFLLAGKVTCNEIRQGEAVDPDSIQPAEGGFPALP